MPPVHAAYHLSPSRRPHGREVSDTSLVYGCPPNDYFSKNLVEIVGTTPYDCTQSRAAFP
jgi:hypothetical protein